MVSTAARPNDHLEISIGDPVYTADGHRLGDVVRANPYEIEVENGLFFRRRYVLALAEVEGCEDGALIASLTFGEAQEREQR